MKTIFLAIVFLIDGEPVMIEGYLPRAQPDREVCQERADFMDAYIEMVPDLPEVSAILCGTSDEIEVTILNLI